MESSLVVRYLVPVDGYRYENITGPELQLAVAQYEQALSEGFFQGLSFHSVIADDPAQNTARTVAGQRETGYLVLYHLGVNCCPAGMEAEIIQSFVGPVPMIDQLEIANTPVFVFEQPESIDSRYVYQWIDHGTIAYFDGADREPLERWLNRYLPLPKLAEHETPELSAGLTVVPGFGYANVEPSDAFAALDELAWAAHSLVDADGVIGGLILTQTDASTPLEQLLQRLQPDATFEETTSEIAGYPVRALSAGDETALIWTQDGISGAIIVADLNRLDSAEHFLEQFLAP